jgi:hypothetical protein
MPKQIYRPNRESLRERVERVYHLVLVLNGKVKLANTFLARLLSKGRQQRPRKHRPLGKCDCC